MGLADLHLHTTYSYDGTAAVPAVLGRAREIGLDVIAITDHDVIDGALLALFITQKVDAGLSLAKTVLRVRELGGVCIAPHPMAGGMGMKSLGAYSIIKALRNPKVAETLIGIETYDGTAIDRISNHYARIFANGLDIAQTGSSDAHVLDTLGFGATEFEGHTSLDFLKALKDHTTKVKKQNEWSAFRVISNWSFRYVESALMRMSGIARV